MIETLIKLDDVNEELKKALVLKDGEAYVDEKWLKVFDALIIDIIQTRNVLNFAVGRSVNIDWEFVLDCIQKAKG